LNISNISQEINELEQKFDLSKITTTQLNHATRKLSKEQKDRVVQKIKIVKLQKEMENYYEKYL
jgi:hypothetical protein